MPDQETHEEAKRILEEVQRILRDNTWVNIGAGLMFTACVLFLVLVGYLSRLEPEAVPDGSTRPLVAFDGLAEGLHLHVDMKLRRVCYVAVYEGSMAMDCDLLTDCDL